MDSFDMHAKNLDLIVTKLPTFDEFYRIQDEAWEKERKSLDASDIFADFTKELKNILKYLKADDIEDYLWHRNVAAVKFKPIKSPHFRLGILGKFENIPVNEDLEVVIAIGFDEDGDYKGGESPELIIYYTNNDFYTDVDLYKPENWRDALNEIFDMLKVK
jgi:hypothetical protein